MKFRVLLCLILLALPVAAIAADATPAPGATPQSTSKKGPAGTPRPTILKRWLRALGIQKTPSDRTATGFKGLEIGLKVEPPEVRIGEVKQLKVIITLYNRGNKIAQLDFPTSQRIEVLVKAPEGKTIEQWSEDQAFDNEPSLVTVNPGERLEYTVGISTRDMLPRQTYAVEAFFPNFEKLRKAVTITTAGAPAPTPTPAPTAAAAVNPAATPSPKVKFKK